MKVEMNLIVKMLIVIIRKEGKKEEKWKEKEKFFWLLKNLLGYLYSKENYIGIELVSVWLCQFIICLYLYCKTSRWGICVCGHWNLTLTILAVNVVKNAIILLIIVFNNMP